MIVQTSTAEQLLNHAGETWYVVLCRIAPCQNHRTAIDLVDYDTLGAVLHGALDCVISEIGGTDCILYAPIAALLELDVLNEILFEEYNHDISISSIEPAEYTAFTSLLRKLNLDVQHFQAWADFDAERTTVDNLRLTLQGLEPEPEKVDRVLDTIAEIKSWKDLRDCDKYLLRLYSYRRKAG